MTQILKLQSPSVMSYLLQPGHVSQASPNSIINREPNIQMSKTYWTWYSSHHVLPQYANFGYVYNIHVIKTF